MKKVSSVVLIHLIILISDVKLSETSNHDNTTKVETTIGHVKQLNGTENATALDQNSSNDTTTQSILTTTLLTTTSTEATPSTADPDLLIPPATVAAQIVNADVSTKKPSRLQAAVA